MSLFGRKKRPPHDPEPIERRVTAIAREVAAEAGYETVAVETADPLDPALMGEDGVQIRLHGLITLCRDADPSQWRRIAEDHLSSLFRGLREPNPSDLEPASLLSQVRTRVVSTSLLDGPQTDLAYARPLAPGLSTVLCIDYPETVTMVNSKELARLPITADELFEAGSRNTSAEPIDEHEPLEDGVWLVGGQSLFVASKIADAESFRRLVGPAPHGVVFSVPNRSLILYTKPMDSSVAQNITALARFTAHFVIANADNQPGGVLSPLLYYSDSSGRIEDIGVPDADGGFVIRASGRFGEMLDSLTGDPS